MAFFSLCMCLFIMFFQPSFVFPDTAKYQPLKNSALIALFIYYFWGNKSNKNFLSVKTNRYLIYFMFFQILSATLSIWFQAGIVYFNIWLRYLIVYYLIVKSAVDKRRIIYICAVIISAIIYLNYYSITKFILNYQSGMRAGGFGWFDNSNDLAIILVSSLCLIMLIAETTKNNLYRYLLYFIASSFIINLLFTASRNAILGLVVVMGLNILYSRKMSRIIKITTVLILFFSIMGAGMSIILSRSDLSGLSGDESSENRLIQWKSGFHMILKHPCLGVGPDQFESNAKDFGGVRGLAPHNTLVQVFSETGIPGGIFFIMFSIYPIIESFRYFKNTNYISDELIIYRYISFAIIGYWCCAIFSNRDKDYIIYILVALLVAIKENVIEKKYSEVNSDK